ncbi:transglutaminase-like domain-containing protein [soil metagenome]
MTGRRPARGFILVNTLFFWAAMAVASVQLWPIYQAPALVLTVAVTVGVASIVAILGAVLRWKTAVVVLVGLAVYFAFGVPLAVPDRAIGGVLPSLDGERELMAGTALGWKQLLTITLPVGAYQALLVPVFVLVLVATVAGLSAALRARAGDLAVLAPVTVFIVAIVFGADFANWPRITVLTLLAVLLVWLVWRRWYRRRLAIARLTAATTDVGEAPAVASGHRTFDARTFLSGFVILALAAGASVAVTAALPPTGPRSVARTAIEQPFDPRDYSSPLAGFRSYLEAGEADATIFTVAGLPRGALLRIATLDSYNGIVYSVGSSEVDSASGSFTRVPFRFDQTIAGTRAALDVAVGDYDGVWVPTIGQLESVTFSGARAATLSDAFYYNDVSGTAVDTARLRRGDSYHLEAVVPTQPSAAALDAVTAGTADVPTPGPLPQELNTVLDGYTSDAASPGQKLAAMIAGLKANGHISHGLANEPASRSGHSSDRIATLLTDQRMIGDAEQFSVTAALMAHQLGFPARVVFGFAPTVAGSGATAVTGASVSAWIEVDTAQYGWVSIDPNPDPGPIPSEQPEDPQVVSRPPSIVQPPADDPPTTAQQAPPESSQDEPDAVAPWVAIALIVLRVLGWVALGLGVLVAPFLAVIAVKARRRRRRRLDGSPLDRVRGGWNEFQDAVVDHGFEPPGAATRVELAHAIGSARSLVLAAVVDRAVFAPGETDDDEADRVWTSVDDLRFALDAGLSRRRRLAASISLRSFGRSRFVAWLVRRSAAPGNTA